jgi:hypothetical protein
MVINQLVNKMLRMYWIAEEVPASKEGLRSICLLLTENAIC